MAWRLKLVPEKTSFNFFRWQWFTFGGSIALMVVAVLAFLVPLLVPLPAMFLGLFTSAIQALIFATLAAYYIGEAVHEEHHA